MNDDSNLSLFFKKYRVKSITESESYRRAEYTKMSRLPLSASTVVDDYVQVYTEKMVTVTLSEQGLKALMDIAKEKEFEDRLREIPQVRDAYSRYKVIESLYREE